MKETIWDLVTPLGFTTPWLLSFTICEATNFIGDESTYKNIPSGDIRTITEMVFYQDLQCQHLKTTTTFFFQSKISKFEYHVFTLDFKQYEIWNESNLQTSFAELFSC